MYYKGLFFENEEQLNKAIKLLEDNSLTFTDDNIYNQFFIQEADAQLDSLYEDYTEEDVYDLAYDLRKAGDIVIDSEVVNEVTMEWINGKKHEEEV